MDNYDTGIYTDNPDDTMRYLRSTQAVSMVRCKECDHTNARSKGGEYWHCGVFNLWMNEDFYCYCGDKKC